MKNRTVALALILGSILWTGCGDDSSPTGPTSPATKTDTLGKVDVNIPVDTTKKDTVRKDTSKVDTAKRDTTVVRPDTSKVDTARRDTTVVKPDTSKVDTAKKDTVAVRPLSLDLIGKWQADTSMTVSMFPVGISSVVVFRADGTFLSTMSASLLGNPIAGDLYRGEGMWVDVGADSLVAVSTNCSSADTATATSGMLAGKSLPFKQVGNAFAANPLVATTCPAPMVIKQRPVAGKIRIVQSMTLPTQGKQDIPLTFVSKP